MSRHRLAALADTMLDVPEWVELRGALRRGEARVTGLSADRRSFVTVATRWSLIGVVGRPDAAWIAAAAAAAEPGDVLVAAEPAGPHVAAAIPHWRRGGAQVLTWPAGVALPAGEDDGTLLASAADIERMGEVPDALRDELLDAAAAAPVAVVLDAGRPASFAFARGVTESLWQVSVETLAEYRRRGLAVRAVRRLAAALAPSGKWPVWFAEDGDAAGSGLARALGFEPAARLAVFSGPG